MVEKDEDSTPGQLNRLRASLSGKLKNEAKGREVATDYVRKQYVFTLFLRRLFATDSSQWMLLGGNALLIRTGGGRFTQDIDLARTSPWDDHDTVLAELQELAKTPIASDPFRFDLHRITHNREADAFGYGTTTATVSVVTYLGAQVFETFNIDLTNRRHVDSPVDKVPLRPIIDHDTLQGLPSVPVVPVENHLADKICAMYEVHSNGPSTRYRDLVDIVRIVQQLTFNAERLSAVLNHETQRRRMDRPTRFAPPAAAWERNYPEAAATFAEFPRNLWPLRASLEVANASLNEVLAGTRTHGDWNPDLQSWS